MRNDQIRIPSDQQYIMLFILKLNSNFGACLSVYFYYSQEIHVYPQIRNFHLLVLSITLLCAKKNNNNQLYSIFLFTF